MKNFIKDKYPEEDCSYDQLRQAVKEAWESIIEDQLRSILDTINQRCEAYTVSSVDIKAAWMSDRGAINNIYACILVGQCNHPIHRICIQIG